MSLKDIEIIIEKLEKTMKNGGLGGTGSVKMDGAVLPTRNKLPKPGHNSGASKVKIPSVGQASKKNPIKSAQQIHNKDIKDIKMKEAQQELNEVVKTLPNGQWELSKADVIRKKPGEKKGASSEERAASEKQQSETKARSEVEEKLKSPEFRDKALAFNIREHSKSQETAGAYDKAVQTVDPDAKPAVATKKRKATYIEQFNRRKEAPDKKIIAREADEKLNKTLEERLEILEKRCWKGYEPTPGKKAYDEGSCRPIKKKECECDDCECDNVEKSKYPGAYDINDNARRKANNVDAEESPIQSMKRVKKYGASGPSKLNDTVRELKIKSKKQPVKVYTKEELDEINQKKAA